MTQTGPEGARGCVVQKNRPHPATTEMMMKQSYLKTTLLLLLLLMVMREPHPARLHFFSPSRTPNTSNKRQTNEEISLDVIIFLQEGGVMFWEFFSCFVRVDSIKVKAPRSDRYFDRFSFFVSLRGFPLGLVSYPNNKVAQQVGHLYLLLSYELEQILASWRHWLSILPRKPFCPQPSYRQAA